MMAGNARLSLMCEWGTEKLLEVAIPAHLSSTGVEKRKEVGIDACIYELVKALNTGGVATITSCCGHGKGPGSISLADGREMIIATSPQEGRKIDVAP